MPQERIKALASLTDDESAAMSDEDAYALELIYPDESGDRCMACDHYLPGEGTDVRCSGVCAYNPPVVVLGPEGDPLTLRVLVDEYDRCGKFVPMLKSRMSERVRACVPQKKKPT